MHISKNINNYYQIGQLWCVAYFFGGVPHCMSLTNSGQGTFFIKKILLFVFWGREGR